VFKSIRTGNPRSPLAVVGVFSKPGGLPRGLELPAAARKSLLAAVKTPGFKADVGETLMADSGHLLLGLGARDDVSAESLRRAATGLLRALDRMETRAARIHVAGAVPRKAVDTATVGRCFGEALGLANWRVDFFDGTATRRSDALPILTVTTDDKTCTAGLREGLLVADCANEARRVAATPPNICNPPWVASEARRLARKAGLTCRVIRYAEAERMGMGGIVNVGKGSAAKPCLIILEHKPPRPKRGVKVALVGKTMTYDTGGYSLKISGSMKGMKNDGNGGCCVLGTMLAVAARKLPVHVVGLLPCAENMVSSDSYRPDDIIEMYNGVTVEVTNTDAEGRLILGDALAYACKHVKPTAIIDVATLTGGVVVALGSWSAGMWCGDDDLRGRLEASARTTGEKVWSMPLWTEHRDFMRARHADVWNSAPKRDGHAIQGAAFLSFFVDEDLPWAHLDIAGVSAVDGDTGMFVAGPTGFGVRLLTDVVAGYC
jgi:leucyl aminopeptidase